METRRLLHLRRVIETGSISAAATGLGLSQPALTKSIRILEADLGTALLHRRARGVVATQAGLALIGRAALIGTLLDDARREIDFLRAGKATVGVIGAGPSWLRERLPEVIAATIGAHPHMRLRVQPGYDQPLLRDLRAGTLHLVFAELPAEPDAAGLDLLPLGTDDFVVACRRGHPLAETRLHPKDLLAFPWVLSPQPSRARTRLAALFATHGLPAPEPTLETSSTELSVRVLAQSDMLGFQVRRNLAAPDTAELICLDAPGLGASRTSGAIVRRGGFLPPPIRAVLCAMAELCETCMPEGYGTATICSVAGMDDGRQIKEK